MFSLLLDSSSPTTQSMVGGLDSLLGAAAVLFVMFLVVATVA